MLFSVFAGSISRGPPFPFGWVPPSKRVCPCTITKMAVSCGSHMCTNLRADQMDETRHLPIPGASLRNPRRRACPEFTFPIVVFSHFFSFLPPRQNHEGYTTLQTSCFLVPSKLFIICTIHAQFNIIRLTGGRSEQLRRSHSILSFFPNKKMHHICWFLSP